MNGADMIRFVTLEDAKQIMKIYNNAILHTTATFDMEIKQIEQIKDLIKEHIGTYPFYVEEENGIILGYASLSLYRPRKAFEQTVELSIYIDLKSQGKGIGSKLMEALLSYAKQQKNIHSIVSLITGDNMASIKLHEKYGFSYCGELKEAGHKFGRDLDLKFYQYMIRRTYKK